jgi:hypothetical protein
MKIALFNIQNLFHRDRVFTELERSRNFLNWNKEFDDLLQNKAEKPTSMERLRELAYLLRFDKTNYNSYAILRKKEGELYFKGMETPNETKADEKTNWNGWIKIQTTPISSKAIAHKAQVIRDIDPDILILQEVEDRNSLDEFNNLILPELDCTSFDHCILVPNSEGKGREQALLLKNGHELDSIKFHIIDTSEKFTHELIEYRIKTKEGELFYVLSAYFYEDELNMEDAWEIRNKQAENVSKIYQNILLTGQHKVMVTGTLNAPSYCKSISPLLQESDLKDITRHLSFEVDYDEGIDESYHRMGAYRKGVNIKQKDFMLLSPELFSRMTDSGLNRRAMWPKERPQWSTYTTLKAKADAASEHPAIWCTIN